MVMNKGVKVVSGAFRTAPRATLHELTRILPTSYYIEKLTQTSSLRLYHAPRTSQLLVRLGPYWDGLVQNGPHTSNGGVVQSGTIPLRSGSGKQRPTALEALGERVDPMGPCIDVTAITPWEVHNWKAHVSCEGVTNPKSRNELVNGLYNTLTDSSTVIIRLAGTVSNKNHFDDKLVGGVAASVMEGKVGMRTNYTHTLSWCLGTEVEQYDVDLFAISKATKWLSAEYSRAPAPHNIYIISSNDLALCHITNTWSLDNQTELHMFHRALTKIFSTIRDTHIHLVWSLVCRKRSQDTGARKAALQACTHAPLSTLNHIQSATYVKRKARQRAYHQWSTQWAIDQQKTILHDVTPYDYAITQPPDGHNHPLFTQSIPPKKPLKDYVPITRCTTCTAMRLAACHSFTSKYSRCHRLDLPPEAHTCPCGFPDWTTYHLVYDCPRYRYICEHMWTYTHRNFNCISLDECFGTDQAYNFLLFLQKSRAASRPEVGPLGPFDPG